MSFVDRGRRSPKWTISVHSADNTREIFHGACEDEKEIQALATEARSHNLSWKIWIRDSYGRLRSWD